MKEGESKTAEEEKVEESRGEMGEGEERKAGRRNMNVDHDGGVNPPNPDSLPSVRLQCTHKHNPIYIFIFIYMCTAN